ncbi:carbohydrate ABC transporter permease [Bacillus sp. FJAT-49732]|uniref:Carbohydrate ABC transporter permease n=1 Tax=Lederbergia citrisecunda TaxID=2833583 RepID=A0A942TP75_9BACI|nr:carbohydrate ABC transporter permease [Lederbergia citrisecunda]MBS4201915.1 carbohydrate ABC transporter permease [Lederbergia citrisecunda]
MGSNYNGFRRKKRHITKQFTAHVFLILFGISFLFPFVWMLSTSLKPESQIFKWPPEWIPETFMWQNFPEALTFVPFALYFKNTLVICVLTVLGTIISSAFVAYGFARIQWRGRNIFFFLMLTTMMLPYQVVMVPLFLVFKEIGWVGTFKPLIIPAFFGTNAFFIFLLRQFFLTIPYELSDAAKIDGCSEFRIFWQIVLPLARPAIATVGLFTFMENWNDFLGPLIYLNDESKYTIALGLQQFIGQYGTQWGMLMAASTVATAPIIILFFFTQKTFIQGISTTGIKG